MNTWAIMKPDIPEVPITRTETRVKTTGMIMSSHMILNTPIMNPLITGRTNTGLGINLEIISMIIMITDIPTISAATGIMIHPARVITIGKITTVTARRI